MSTFTSPIKTKDDHKIKSFKQKVLSLSYIITCGSFLKKICLLQISIILHVKTK